MNGQTLQESQASQQTRQLLPSSLWHIHASVGHSPLKVKCSVLFNDFNSIVGSDVWPVSNRLGLVLQSCTSLRLQPLRTVVAQPLCLYLIPVLPLLTTSRRWLNTGMGIRCRMRWVTADTHTWQLTWWQIRHCPSRSPRCQQDSWGAHARRKARFGSSLHRCLEWLVLFAHVWITLAPSRN